MTTSALKYDEIPQLLLLIENSSKSNELGSILRCASAFGITKVVTIGFSRCSVKGSHGASKNIEIIAFPTCAQAEIYVRQELHCSTIIGLMGPLPNGYDKQGYSVCDDEALGQSSISVNNIESSHRSIPLGKAIFTNYKGHICVGLSKGKQGLPLSIRRCCDSLIHIPHLPFCGNIPLLDTPCCLSITLSFIAESIGSTERSINAHKFDVTRPIGNNVDENNVKRKKREGARALASVVNGSTYDDDDIAWKNDVIYNELSDY